MTILGRRRGRVLDFVTLVTLMLVLVVVLAVPAAAATGAWSQLAPTGTPPAARYSAGSAFDATNDRLILFSGEDFTALPRPTDVWVLTNATGAGGAPSWVELFPSGGPPLGREAQTTVYDQVGNRLLVHGGCGGNCSPALADTWILSNANGLGSSQWTQQANAPVGRAEHSAVFDPATGRMVVFGGHTGFFGTERNDVSVYDADDDSWTALSPGLPPAPRRVTGGAAYDQANNRMILFGGLQAPTSSTYILYNDVWVLTNANGIGGTPQWTQLAPTGTPPAARVAHTVHYDASTNRLIVFGGVAPSPSGDSTFFNDVWVLENANGLGGTPNWMQLTTTGGPPDVRFSVSSGFAPASDRMVVAMGRGGAGGNTLFNDAWVFDLTVSVAIDIKPGSSTNPITLSQKGVVPVAVLGTPDFDASEVDPSKVCFGDAEDESQRDCTVAPGTKLADVNGDTILDLVLHFETQQSGIDPGDTQACLAGELFDTTGIEGCDSVKTK